MSELSRRHMMQRLGIAALVGAVVVPILPAAAQAPPMEAWKQRAETYAAQLPEPDAGWTATARDIHVENSAMGSRLVMGKRIYRPASPPNVDVLLAIYNRPDGSAGYGAEWFADAGKATAQKMQPATVAGQKALIKTEGRKHFVYILMSNNLMVQAVGNGIDAATVEKLLAKIDYAKVAALPSK